MGGEVGVIMKEYVKIDTNGRPIDRELLDENEKIPEGFVLSWQYQEDKTWWSPIHIDGIWVENLTDEKITERLQEIKEQKNKPSDEEMNAIAIMELAEMTMLGGK